MTIRPDHPLACAAAGILAAAALIGASPARSQVMQVTDDGSVRIRAGVGDVCWDAEDATDPPWAGAAMSAPSARAIPAAYSATVDRVSAAQAISPALLEALIWQESRWRAAAVSPAGARGLTQLMPATARALGVDPHDPVAAIEGGARYLRQQLDRFDGDVERALAAYNAGPGRVIRAGGIPAIAETRAYVAAILARLSNPVEQ